MSFVDRIGRSKIRQGFFIHDEEPLVKKFQLCHYLHWPQHLLPRPIGQGLCAQRNEIFVTAQACRKLCTKHPPLPLWESEDLESFLHPHPIRKSENFDTLRDLEILTIASTRTPPPPIGASEDLDVLGDFGNCKWNVPVIHLKRKFIEKPTMVRSTQ